SGIAWKARSLARRIQAVASLLRARLRRGDLRLIRTSRISGCRHRGPASLRATRTPLGLRSAGRPAPALPGPLAVVQAPRRLGCPPCRAGAGCARAAQARGGGGLAGALRVPCTRGFAAAGRG